MPAVNCRTMSSDVAFNLGTYLARAAEQVPDRLAIACGDVQASYAEEERRVNSLGLALRSLGLQKAIESQSSNGTADNF